MPNTNPKRDGDSSENHHTGLGAGVSSGDVFQNAFRRTGFARGKVGGKAIQRRAVRADDFVVVAEVEEHMRVIERRVGADAHEFLRADFDDGNTGIVVEVRNDIIGHRISPWNGNEKRRSQRDSARNAAHHTGGFG